MDEFKFEKLLQGLQHKDREARRYAAKILLSHYPPDYINRAADALLTVLEEKPILDAILLLGKMREQRAVEPLIRLLTDETANSFVREYAAKSLGNIGDERAIKPLLSLLETESSLDSIFLQHQITVALGNLKAREAVPKLMTIVEMDDTAAIALGKIGDTRAIEPLTRFLQEIRPRPYLEEYYRDLTVVIDALIDIKDKRVIAPLLDTLERNRSYQVVQNIVVHALVKIGQPAVEPLLEALNHPASWVRANALIALNRIGDPKAIEPIKPLLHDKNRRVRRQAAYALRKLGHDPDVHQ